MTKFNLCFGHYGDLEKKGEKIICVPRLADTSARSVRIEKLKMTKFILRFGHYGDIEKN